MTGTSEPDMNDFGGEFSEIYTRECECGYPIRVSTQDNNNPEYMTDVYVECGFCGESVHFELPVN